MLVIDNKALDMLSALLLERAGLKIAADGYHGLRLALATRMPALGIDDAREYVARLRQLAGEQELRSLLPLVTVGKTDFFRDPRQFHALENRVIRDMLAKARRENRRLYIWSAGCATGEEPYSLAIVLNEHGAKPSEVDLWATDLNLAAIEVARAGRYPTRRMAGVNDLRMKRFFRRVDDGFEVSQEIKEYVRFDGQNLAAPVFSKVAPGTLDLILCRNVIIYFDLPTIRALMDRFLGALRPGGLLFLGYSESLFQVYDKFEMVEVDGAFVYRRRTGAQDKPPEPKVRPPLPKVPAPRPITGEIPIIPPPVPTRTSTGELPLVNAHVLTPVERLSSAVKMMEKGDFNGALNAFESLTRDEPYNLDAQLTLGNLYSLLGRNDDAVTLFEQILASEPLCVEAHVFCALASLQAGKLGEARSELNKALFLEPTLAIGHYLLAQAQERTRDLEGARKSYRNVIQQLRYQQRPLAGHYPDMPESVESLHQAARYALAALEES